MSHSARIAAVDVKQSTAASLPSSWPCPPRTMGPNGAAGPHRRRGARAARPAARASQAAPACQMVTHNVLAPFCAAAATPPDGGKPRL